MSQGLFVGFKDKLARFLALTCLCSNHQLLKLIEGYHVDVPGAAASRARVINTAVDNIFRLCNLSVSAV